MWSQNTIFKYMLSEWLSDILEKTNKQGDVFIPAGHILWFSDLLYIWLLVLWLLYCIYNLHCSDVAYYISIRHKIWQKKKTWYTSI